MPLLSEMFPSKNLSAEDLWAASGDRPVVVTIEEVTYKTVESDEPGQIEVTWYVRVKEFKKPFKLNTTNAHTIAHLLNTEDTNDWIGQTILLRGVQKDVPDGDGKRKKVWGFDVLDEQPKELPSVPPKSDITGAAAEHKRAAQLMGGKTNFGVNFRLPGQNTTNLLGPAKSVAMEGMIGVEGAVALIDGLNSRGKKWDDLMNHLRMVGTPVLAEACDGIPPSDCPPALLAVARAYVGAFPRVKPNMTDQEKAAVRATLEPPEPRVGADPANAEVVDDKDIPF